MTAQASDVVRLGRRPFSITAVEGEGLFRPEAHGLRPRAMNTGSYRGYIAIYEIVGERLTLVELDLGSESTPPELAGNPPVPWDHYWRYRGLRIPVGFTGRLLIGSALPPRLPHLNMGFWPAWMYARVLELRFAGGALTERADRSAELAAFRERHGDAASRPMPGEPTKDWINRTFSLTFAYSWPDES